MSAPPARASEPAARDAQEQTRVANRRMLKRLAVVAVGMFGFGFLLVPFYEQICNVTGLREIARADTVQNTQVVTSRTIRLELDSNVRHLDWGFRPLEPSLARPGDELPALRRHAHTAGAGHDLDRARARRTRTEDSQRRLMQTNEFL